MRKALGSARCAYIQDIFKDVNNADVTRRSHHRSKRESPRGRGDDESCHEHEPIDHVADRWRSIQQLVRMCNSLRVTRATPWDTSVIHRQTHKDTRREQEPTR